MRASPPLTVIGLMSGTSLDGIDAALITTDGEHIDTVGKCSTTPYDDALRDRIRAVIAGSREDTGDTERALTEAHGEAVRRLREQAPVEVDLIGFHGQTVLHDPDNGITRQLGDGALLATLTGIDVVADFRTADVMAGGEGAPFAPLYHAARAEFLEKPLAVVNMGGVGNVTWIGSGIGSGAKSGDRLLAFDTGPGNALLDDWAHRHTGRAIDKDGALARAGTVRRSALDQLLEDPFFARKPPKSLDREHFSVRAGTALVGVSPEDGAATLVAFSAMAVARSADWFPEPVQRWLVCGGGRHNPVLMCALADRLAAPVAPVEAVGWDGDALEAQAFGYLAARSLRGLPLSLPTTTGVPHPTTGGRLFKAR